MIEKEYDARLTCDKCGEETEVLKRLTLRVVREERDKVIKKMKGNATSSMVNVSGLSHSTYVCLDCGEDMEERIIDILDEEE